MQSSWCTTYGPSERTSVTGVILYGLPSKPQFLQVPGEVAPVPVGDDFDSRVFYEPDLDRMQVRKINEYLAYFLVGNGFLCSFQATELQLDLCSSTNREITWVF